MSDSSDVAFKALVSFDERKATSSRIMAKHPDKIPCILERRRGDRLSGISQKKFLIERHFTVAQFLQILRRRVMLDSTEAVYLFFQDRIMPPTSALLGDMYQKHKDPDGFLYVTYASENTFG